MSFVVGFMTGVATGESLERRKRRRAFRDYMDRRGFTIIDHTGATVPLDTVIDEILIPDHERSRKRKSGKSLLVAGIAVVLIAAITGGSAVAVTAAVS